MKTPENAFMPGAGDFFFHMRSLRVLVLIWYAAACLSIITAKEIMQIFDAPGCLTVVQVHEQMDH